MAAPSLREWARPIRLPRDAREEAQNRIPPDLRAGRVEVDEVERVGGPRQRHQRVRHAGRGEVPVEQLRLLREHVDVQPTLEDKIREAQGSDQDLVKIRK